jgi:hypothetical protein
VSLARGLAGIVAAGLLLRLALFAFAEHRLEVSEAIVGLMAFDILEGRTLPFFFYGTAYNGGGALEAYLAAAVFALLGPSAAALKLPVLALWLAAAGLLADLCGRTLERTAALLAMGFFGLATPFFLEWSLKARGGFIETVLASAVLLWLADPPGWLRRRWRLQCAAFGLAVGLGLWMSEMLLAMVACAGAWLLLRLPPHLRLNAALATGAATAVGLLPLAAYNALHAAEHLRASVLWRVLQPGEREPLTAAELALSADFVLGPAWPLLAGLLALGAARGLPRLRQGIELGHVATVHVLLYGLAYTLAGERYLAQPPSRVLFALYPSLAILFGQALAPARGAGMAARAAAALTGCAWALCVLASIAGWLASGEPREAHSWRGHWALVDAAPLRRELVSLGVGQVYASRWTVPPLVFEQRRARRREPDSPQLGITSLVPASAPRQRMDAALVLLREGPLAGYVSQLLEARRIPHRRRDLGAFAIFHGIPAPRLHQGIGLPAVIAQEDWPPEPDPPDGFN